VAAVSDAATYATAAKYPVIQAELLANAGFKDMGSLRARVDSDYQALNAARERMNHRLLINCMTIAGCLAVFIMAGVTLMIPARDRRQLTAKHCTPEHRNRGREGCAANREIVMLKVDLVTVERVVAAIKNEREPSAQLEASAIRDRWLAEVDAGLLEMSAEARLTLENACFGQNGETGCATSASC
jgi:hypothetical protein